MPEKTDQPVKPTGNKPSKSIAAQVADRIKDSDNVLVALSKNPSVDELSAALGLTFVLDKLGKHATAIFSGAVPNAIEFLEPEKTFESNTNSLQDFIIALDKEKADHLRYKIEGDFVKVYITPYKTTLTENDLEFSHGDYNVDLIIALNVESESDLDSALSEYGKIKHDASSINISAAAPGKFGDLEWGDPAASSVSEMVSNLAELLDDGSSEEKLIDKSTSTALLAGIVAATNRFSNERTTADTMSIAARLMAGGADQQLISSSIPVNILTNDTVDVNNEVAAVEETLSGAVDYEPEPPKPKDPTKLEINRSAPVPEPELSAKKPDSIPDLPASEPAPIAPTGETPTAPEKAPEIETIAVPAPAEAAPVDLPTPELEPLAEPIIPVSPEKPAGISEDAPAPQPATLPEPESVPEDNQDAVMASGEKVLTPPSETGEKPPVDYAAEMEKELREDVPEPTLAPSDLPVAEMAPIEAPVAPVDAYAENAVPVVPEPVINEAVQSPVTMPPTAPAQPAPNVDPAQPPIAPMGVDPNAEYVNPPLPMPSDGTVLPPPPTPFNLDDTAAPMPPMTAAPEPVAAPAPMPSAQEYAQGIQNDVQAAAAQAPAAEPIMPAVMQEQAAPAVSPSTNGVNPVMQDQVYADPGAFHIPGM